MAALCLALLVGLHLLEGKAVRLLVAVAGDAAYRAAVAGLDEERVMAGFLLSRAMAPASASCFPTSRIGHPQQAQAVTDKGLISDAGRAADRGLIDRRIERVMLAAA
jgi:hypothetical protein